MGGKRHICEEDLSEPHHGGTEPASSDRRCQGGADALSFAQQLLKTEAMRLEDSFTDGLRGLDVYGAKVVRPNDLVQLILTYAAETAI